MSSFLRGSRRRTGASLLALVLQLTVAPSVFAFIGSRSRLRQRFTSTELAAAVPGTTDGEVLASCLGKLQDLAYETVVIKYGGHAMGTHEARASFAKDVALLQAASVRCVVVHGGGPMIAELLDKLGIETRFEAGLRVTDEATVEVAEMVLSGKLNKRTVAEIGQAGGSAIGLSGKDDKLMCCRPVKPELGLVGQPVAINVELLDDLLDMNLMPVIAPIGIGVDDDGTYNVNADVAAGMVAKAMGASRLLLLTDVPGVLDKGGTLLPELSSDDVKRLTEDGTISGGMIPKLETAVDAAEGGVESAVILDGRVDHAVLLSLLGENSMAGTSVTAVEAAES